MIAASIRRSLARHLLRSKQSIENHLVDSVLGLDVKQTSQIIGSSLKNARPSEWAGEFVWQEAGESSHPMTSYHDLVLLLQNLQLPNNALFVELGAGFGRAGFVIGLLYPHLRYIGYELVSPRVAAAQRAHKKLRLNDNVKFCTTNLASWSPTPSEDADIYYVFCSFCEPTGRHVLGRLQQIRLRKKIQLILNLGMHGFEPDKTAWLTRQENIGIFLRYTSQS